MIHKGIYKLGVKLRSPEIYSQINFLKESEGWTRKELEDYQLQKLKDIVKIATERSTFYRELFEKNKFKLSDINKLEDITKIPCISKQDLLSNVEHIQNTEGYRKMFFSETSGSTGEPLAFYRNSEWDAAHRAAQIRGYSWHDVDPWDKNGYFWGYSFEKKNQFKTKFLDFLLNRFRIFSYDEDEINKFGKKLKKAQYLEGYSSMIYETAKIINKQGIDGFNLKMVKGTSEKIFEGYQEEVEKAFGQKMISEYGACECGIIAYECKEGNMHVTMENVIVEEENGEAIITNLVSDSFPIIRYKLGDSIILDKNSECKCGRKHLIIKEVTGRIGKLIEGRKENYPTLTLNYIFKNLVLYSGVTINYQAIQNKKGELEIYLDKKISIEVEKILLKECFKYYKDDIKVNIYPEKLKRDYSKKFKDFISNIN